MKGHWNCLPKLMTIQVDLIHSVCHFGSSLFAKVNDHSREAEIYGAINEIEKRISGCRSSKKDLIILIGYLAALTVAELTVTFFNMGLGLVAETAILFALLFHPSLIESYNFSNLLRSMMVIPMIRIVGLSYLSCRYLLFTGSRNINTIICHTIRPNNGTEA